MMSGNTINNTITVGVTLGVAGYSNELTVTGVGEIKPSLYGTDGVDASSGKISNSGLIVGSSGGDTGGTGVDIQNGSLINSGTIVGGASSYDGTLGTGGAGLLLSGAIVFNSGLILGGVGGSTGFSSGGSSSGVGVLESGGTLTNSGTIIGGAQHPRELVSKNGNSYYIDSAAGIGANITGGNFVNEGLIVGGYAGGSGAEISGGTITNDGAIVGGAEAEGVNLSAGSLLNNGTILAGHYGAGSYVASGLDGVYQSGGTLMNDGLIIGSNAKAFVNEGETNFTAGYGVDAASGTIFNFGTISAGNGGVNNTGYEPNGDVGVVLGRGTLITGGLITGGMDELGNQDDAVALHSSSAEIIVEPGAAFTGSVVGFGDSLIQLATGTTGTDGTLDMNGSFSGFGTIAFVAGAKWQVVGIVDELAAGQTITGFTSQDTILLQDFVASSETFIPGVGLEVSNGAISETLNIKGNFSTGSFVITDAGSATQVELLCFLRGTHIMTPAGAVAIEDIVIGDPVITRFGGYQKVKWIGRQSFTRQFIKTNYAQVPICIAAGALGPHLPHRDLYVSPGHSMLIGEVLVLASSLINGITITRSMCPEEVHYYQLEFEAHDCVQAEGCWSESFCDFEGLRNQFHNRDEFWKLYSNHVTPSKHLMCAPRPDSGPVLNAALRNVVAHAAACVLPGPLQGNVDEMQHSGYLRGWALDVAYPELPVLLEIALGDRVIASYLACDYRSDLAAAGLGRGRCAFTFQGPRFAPRLLPKVRVRRAQNHDELPLPLDGLSNSIGASKSKRKRA